MEHHARTSRFLLILKRVLQLGIALSFVSLFRSTLGQATDFEVFWRVGQSLVERVPFYDVAREGGMVFKYPPWVAPFFYPLGWIDFVTAKGIWALIELISLFLILMTLKSRFRVSEWALTILFPVYWGVWVVHFLDGQVMLPVLALYLYFLSTPRWDAALRGFIPLLMSIKVFTLFPLLSVLDRFKSKRAIYGTVILGVAFLAGAAFLSFDGNIPLMLERWSVAASSGAQFLPEGHTRGPKNQSMVSFFCRKFDVESTNTMFEVLLSLAFFAAATIVIHWRKSVKATLRFGELTTVDYLFIFLAFTAPLHPLPWHHLYVWTFPLAVYRFDQDNRRPLYWLSIFLIAVSSSRAIPVLGIGDFLEWNVGRAWGALLLVGQTLFKAKTK